MFASNHPGAGSVAANVHAKYATTAKKAPKMIARVLGLIDSPPTRTTPTGESDILHPLLLIFDSRSPSVQKVYPRRSRASSEEGRIPCEGRPNGRESVDELPDT